MITEKCFISLPACFSNILPLHWTRIAIFFPSFFLAEFKTREKFTFCKKNFLFCDFFGKWKKWKEQESVVIYIIKCKGKNFLLKAFLETEKSLKQPGKQINVVVVGFIRWICHVCWCFDFYLCCNWLILMVSTTSDSFFLSLTSRSHSPRCFKLSPEHSKILKIHWILLHLRISQSQRHKFSLKHICRLSMPTISTTKENSSDIPFRQLFLLLYLLVSKQRNSERNFCSFHAPHTLTYWNLLKEYGSISSTSSEIMLSANTL